jgi:hypothetical protein
MTERRLPDPHFLRTETGHVDRVDEKFDMMITYLDDLVRILGLELDDKGSDLTVAETRQKMGSQIGASANTSVSGTYNISPNQSVVLVNASSSARTVALPDPLENKGRIFHVKKTNTNGNDVTVSCVTSGATIDEDNEKILTGSLKPSIMCYSDGREYWII